MGGGGGGGGGGGVGFGAAMSCFLLAALSSGFLLNEAPAAEGSSVGAFFMEVAGATADFTVGVFCTDGGEEGEGEEEEESSSLLFLLVPSSLYHLKF